MNGMKQESVSFSKIAKAAENPDPLLTYQRNSCSYL